MAGTLLLFGFAPFGGAARNPSGEIAEALDRRSIGELRVRGVVLPVARRLAFPALRRALRVTRPRVVVGLGVATGRSFVCVERRAVNCDDYGEPDERGEQPRGTPIASDGPDEVLATAPVDAVVAAIRAAGVPAARSEDAGRFLCNHVYYRMLRETARLAAAKRPPLVFLHLPALPETVARRPEPTASMALATSRRGVVAAIRFLARAVKEGRGLEDRGAMVVVVMGVAGAGKTEIGRRLAAALGWRFVEGDDFHSAANRAKLARGIPLDDADRAPWLAALRAEIERTLAAGESAVLTCSALKQAYRRELVVDRERVRLVHLTGSRALLEDRIRGRRGHFADPSILASQLATLEPPEDAIAVDVTPPPEEIVAEIRRALGV